MKDISRMFKVLNICIGSHVAAVLCLDAQFCKL